MSMRLLICLFALSLLAPASSPAQRRQLHYEPERVTLTGKLVYRTFYGPPNYGEDPKTDSRETQPVLILDSAVDVNTGNDPADETERSVGRITLVVQHTVKDFVGKRMVVEGTLFHAITGHHHTKVLMTVSSIKKAGRG